MKKIKILQIIHSLHMGGAEYVVSNICRHINKTRFDIEVCCLNVKGVLGEKLESDGYNIMLMNKGSKLGPIRSYFSLKRIIEKSKPDIIHTHSEPAFINIGPLYILNKMPSLVHTYHFGNYPNIPKKYIFLQKLYAQFADKLIAVSDSQKNAIIKWLGANQKITQTIWNGIPENPYLDNTNIIEKLKSEFNINRNELVIGCIAILSEQKGIIYLLDAAKEIVKNNNNVKFLIIGTGPLEKQLRENISDLRYKDRIIFTGWRNDAENIINILDIFIQPSLWEAFSIVLLEAMAARKPIIVTDVADAKKVIKDGVSGLIIPAKDSNSIIKAINRFITDHNFRESAANQAYMDFINNYTLDKMVKNYEELYIEMMR